MTITWVEPSHTVQLHIDGVGTMEGPRGSTIQQFILAGALSMPAPAVGAILNGELQELTTPVHHESTLSLVLMSDADGARIYRRSLSFLLSAAFNNLFSGATLHIDHSVYPGGYYCHVGGRKPLDSGELSSLKSEMNRLVSMDLPFDKKEISLVDAIQMFSAANEMDKVDLLKYRTKEHVTVYTLGSYTDYHHGYMVPSTGFLKWFDLAIANGGFIMRYPKRHTPTKTDHVEQFPALLRTFKIYGDWLKALGIDNVGALNDSIAKDRGKELVLVSEAFHEQQITNIARQISDRKDVNKVILVSGPTSSGKTTFSRRLTVQLLSLGISPFPLELDNYFIDREKTPKDSEGNYDFEDINAIDLPKLSEHLTKLINGQAVRLPKFNFVNGRQELGEEVTLRPGQMLILEGIHGLNPQLIPPYLYGRSYKIYISALTQLNLDYHNRVSTTDTRLLRRIVRDNSHRGYSAAQTIGMWESVRRGEEKHIFAYQDNADIMFNSALVYELAILKPMVEPLLRQVPHGTAEYIEAKRLLAFLEWFLPMQPDLIPDNSILREFVGGSNLIDFSGWKHETLTKP